MQFGLAFGSFLKVVVKEYSTYNNKFDDSTNSKIILDKEITNYLGLSNSFNFEYDNLVSLVDNTENDLNKMIRNQMLIDSSGNQLNFTEEEDSLASDLTKIESSSIISTEEEEAKA